MTRLGWMTVALATTAAACSSESTGGGGSGGAAAGAGGAPTTTTSGGSGAVGGAGGAAGGGVAGMAGSGGEGGAGGAPITWSEPPLHLEERCIGDAVVGEFAAFPIPDDTLGFAIVGHAPTPSQGVGVFQLRPVGFASVINGFDVVGKDINAFTHAGTVAAGNPLSDLPQAVPTKIGDWQVVFGDDGSVGVVDACVYARRTLDGAPHGGVMDINVIIAPGTVTESYMQGVVDRLFDDYYDPLVGLTQGTVTFSAAAAQYTTIDDFAEYQELLRSSAGIGPRPAVNVFVVGDFDGMVFGNAIGVAGGIPGAPMVHGTNGSGVAIQPSGNEGNDAGVLAHEIGHLGGLFHTTELDLSSTDPLDDTVECPGIADPNSCPDRTNVMFPLALGGDELTADQVRVLVSGALYRGILSAGGSPGASLSAEEALRAPTPPSAALASPLFDAVAVRPPADEVERLLSALWCGHGGGDHRALVWRKATPARLLELARDEEAFDLVRARALAVLAEHALSPAERAELAVLAAELARSARTRHAALLAAIDVLAEEDLAALAAAAPAVALRGDAAAVERLRRAGVWGD